MTAPLLCMDVMLFCAITDGEVLYNNFCGLKIITAVNLYLSVIGLYCSCYITVKIGFFITFLGFAMLSEMLILIVLSTFTQFPVPFTIPFPVT